jgi:hypothetical protein
MQRCRELRYDRRDLHVHHRCFFRLRLRRYFLLHRHRHHRLRHRRYFLLRHHRCCHHLGRH